MKISSSKICSAILSVLIATVLVMYGEKFARPPMPEQIIGTWIGYEENRLMFCRLELKAQGKGFFSTVHTDNSPMVYRIDHWSLVKTNLDIKLSPLSPEAEPIFLRGTGWYDMLYLQMGGIATNGWRRRLDLLNETEILVRNKKASDEIARFANRVSR